MNCRETKRYLETFLDGELDAEANLKVLEHLNRCGECTRTFDAEKALRAALRDRACGPKAPSDLCARVAAAMDAVDRAARRRWLAPVLSAAAAVVVTATVTTLVLARPARPMDEARLAAFAATWHETSRHGSPGPSECLGCCSKCSKQKAEDFFVAKTGSSTCLHDLDKAGYGWRSAVLGDLRGRMMCWTVQKKDDALVTHVALNSDQIANRVPGNQWRRYEAGGRVVLMHNAGTFT